MPFGLRNSAQTFQRFLNEIFTGCDFIFSYIDDILIFSNSEKEHEFHLTEVFKRLEEYGLNINPTKCVFGVQSIEFLSYHISFDGIRPSDSRVNILSTFEKPQTITKMEKFLGMIHYYQKHIPHIAEILSPLHNMVNCAKNTKEKVLIWSEESESAFLTAKNKFAQNTLLNHLNENAELSVAVDASNIAIGAVLQQFSDNKLEPIAYFSKKLSPTEVKYSTFDRELLAIYKSIHHFRHFLEGRIFTIFTDHKPLTFALNSKTERSPRQTRHLEYIAEFTSDIKYIKGKDNIVADTLSRIPEIGSLSVKDICIQTLYNEQQKDNNLHTLLSSHDKSNLKEITVPISNIKIWCEISFRSPRPYLPLSMRKIIFEKLHGLSHPGVRTTRKLIQKKYFWPKMRTDINTWATACLQCQKSKIHRHTKSPITTMYIPSGRFEHIHIDTVGPLPPSSGNKYILTVIDRYTRWPEAYPMKDNTAKSVVQTLTHHYIPRFGVPINITMDQGKQFTSILFKEFTNFLGAHKIHTSPYHPQANGMVERFHRQLKACIKAATNNTHNWSNEIPLILLGLRSTVKEDIKLCPAELVYGQTLRLPGELVTSNNNHYDEDAMIKKLRQYFSASKSIIKHHITDNKSYVPDDLKTCKYVFLRDHQASGLQPPYSGPHEVLKRTPKNFIIRTNNGFKTVSIDNVKPAYIDTTRHKSTLNTNRKGITLNINNLDKFDKN